MAYHPIDFRRVSMWESNAGVMMIIVVMMVMLNIG